MTASLGSDGFALQPAHLPPDAAHTLLATLAKDIPTTRPAAGIRNLLTLSSTAREIATSASLAEVARQHLGPDAFPVRGILFDKSPSSNWLVPFHQDISIPVQGRVDVPGYGPWSIKNGVQHVQPPSAILGPMLTLRLHLDDVDKSNGPLRVFPGSHTNGILDDDRLTALTLTASPVACVARRGDLLLMRPLLVHGSGRATEPTRRRILHIEYAADPLPSGLDWART